MRDYKQYTILDNKATTGIGNTIDVKDYRHIILLVATADSGDLTIKVSGSAAETAPTFSSAQSVSNHWTRIALYDYEDSQIIEGDTGVAADGTDICKTLMVNVDGLNYINVEVTARVAGSVNVKAQLYNNK